jgi:hypothetical protein
MKKLIFIFLTVLFMGCAGSKKTAGINDSSVPSSTNTILVQTNLDAKSAYKKVARILQNRGYTFRSTDETLKSISTEFRGISQRYGVDNTFVRIGANVQGESNSKVSIRGWYKTFVNEDTETGQTVKKFGQNGSPTRKAWKEIYQVAKSIGDSLSFQKN